MPFLDSIRLEALVACQRTCCLCHERKHTRLVCHHIKQEADGGPNVFENCIPLCPDCHAEVKAFDPRHHPGMTSYSEAELIRRRDDWYAIIRRRSADLQRNLNRRQTNYPRNEALEGEMSFDYSNHDGFFLIGSGLSEFLTHWSRAGRTAIHCYSDQTNVEIALAPPSTTLSELSDASVLDFSSRVRDPKINEILIAKNHYGRFAAIIVKKLQSRSHGDDFDFAQMRYLILPNGSSDFTQRA
ncbi:MAG: HNH endonuclease signature motif containing protein [Luteolibacter sp.]